MPTIVGIPREIKEDEDRVAIAPSGVHFLHQRGHRALIETGVGTGSGIPDAEYEAAGATLAADGGISALSQFGEGADEGVTIHRAKVGNRGVAEAFDLKVSPVSEVLV
jgi:alanine dehydrogenase